MKRRKQMKKYLYIILAAMLAFGFSMGCDMPEDQGGGGYQQQQQQPPGQQPAQPPGQNPGGGAGGS
jgi:hypothetical protein